MHVAAVGNRLMSTVNCTLNVGCSSCTPVHPIYATVLALNPINGGREQPVTNFSSFCRCTDDMFLTQRQNREAVSSAVRSLTADDGELICNRHSYDANPTLTNQRVFIVHH
jgi:hypothetical protein